MSHGCCMRPVQADQLYLNDRDNILFKVHLNEQLFKKGAVKCGIIIFDNL